MNKTDVKILIGYHRPFQLFKSEILVPIHGGRKCALESSKDGKIDEADMNWLLNNCIGDDTGDNWSDKNRYLNEMTPIYWAWKNYDKLGDPKYIGFMQYGKHLIFNPYMEISRSKWIDKSEMYNYPMEKYLTMGNLTNESICNALDGYDLLCAEKISVTTCNAANCRERLDAMSEGKGIVFDKMIEIINKKFPEYTKYAQDINQGHEHYPLNCFVMKKELFFEYCKFVMGVEEEMLNTLKKDFENASVVQKRAFAFCSEFLTSMFISKIEESYKVKKLKAAVLQFELPSWVYNIFSTYKFRKFRYKKYKLLSKLTFGKRSKKYQGKVKEMDRQLTLYKLVKGHCEKMLEEAKW